MSLGPKGSQPPVLISDNDFGLQQQVACPGGQQQLRTLMTSGLLQWSPNKTVGPDERQPPVQVGNDDSGFQQQLGRPLWSLVMTLGPSDSLLWSTTNLGPR